MLTLDEIEGMYENGDTTNDDPSLIGTGAIKYDADKPSVFQGVIKYFPRALWAVAEVSTFGAKKYAWNGWEGVEDGLNRYKDAQFRHVLKQAMGEEVDADSELDHLAHEAWGALATLELYLRQKKEEQSGNKQRPQPEGVWLTEPQYSLHDSWVGWTH